MAKTKFRLGQAVWFVYSAPKIEDTARYGREPKKPQIVCGELVDVAGDLWKVRYKTGTFLVGEGLVFETSYDAVAHVAKVADELAKFCKLSTSCEFMEDYNDVKGNNIEF